MRRAALALLPFIVSALGCVSLPRTPEPRFFVLRPVAPAVIAPAARDGADPVVAVLGVRIPEHLARPQLVLWTSGNEVRIEEFLRWAEPLDAGVTRTLADDLQALLPRHRVVRAPLPALAVARCRVAGELRLFGPRADGRVRLEGTFTVLTGTGDRAVVRRAFAFERGAIAGSAAGWDAGPAVEAMSELLADLAREVAAAVVALPGDGTETPQR